MDYFKSKYKSFRNDDNCFLYQSKKFINPVFITHQINDIWHDDALSGNYQDKECKKIWMIFKPSFYILNKIPNKILIEGASGMGKSTLAREIACRWAKNLLLTDIHLLLLVHVRNISSQKITNFEQLLQCYYTDKDRASNCAKHFTNTQGRHLMILFDGYDEMTTLEQQNGDTILMSIFLRKILPQCYIVVTAKPYFTACLHQYCDCRVEILGFTKADRLVYFRENLSSDNFQIVAKFLQANTIIDRLCCIPLFLINFVSLVQHNMPFPKSLTELMGYAIRLIVAFNKSKVLKDHPSVLISQDKDIDQIIASIASFAFEMLDEEQLVFSDAQIKKASIHIKDNDSLYGLLKAANLNAMQTIQDSKVYSFVHSSVQEYLAAYFLSKKLDIAQEFALKHALWDRKHFGFWTMYIGLTKGKNFPLNALLSNQSTGKKYLLEYRFPGMVEKLKIDKISCLQLYEMFLEAPHNKMKESLRSVVDNDIINLSGENITTTDTEIISRYIIRSHITEWQMIDLSNCHIVDGDLQFLCKLSPLEDEYEKRAIKCLNISNNRICKLSTLFNLANACKINELLASNNMCEDDHYIKKGTTSGTLEVLDLSSNQLENQDVAALCKVLCMHKSLRELNISNSFVTEDITKPLVTTILQCNSFERLECDGNCFQDDNNSIELIQFTINQIKFHRNTINFDGNLDHITYFLVMLECACDLFIEESVFIAKISKVTNLSLDCTDRPKQSTRPTLTLKASQSLQKFDSLSVLNLSGICISDDVADVLVVAFSNNLLSLQHLLMNNCNLNSNAVIKFMNYLKHAKFINTIQMSNNIIDDKATEALIVALFHWNLQNIECINLENNPISLKIFHFVDSLMVKRFEDLHVDFSHNIQDVTNFVKLLECMSNVSTDTSTFLSSLTRINTLNLGCLQENKMDDQVILTRKASEFLKQFEHLTTVDISGIKINEVSADVLSDAFGTNLKLLQCLKMNACGLNSKSAIKLVENLHHTKNFKEIQLCDNFIDDKATENLIIAILHWNSVEVIKLENNQFNEESIIAIQFLLTYFDHNEVFDKEMLDLKCKLENLKSFMILLHCMNRVDNKNSNFICLIVKLKEMHLDLGYKNENNIHTEFTVDGLVFFQRFTNLQYLDISCITMNESSAIVLGTALSSSLLTLEYLYMTDCRITSKTAIILLEHLQKNRTIKILNLTHNLIDDEATKAIVIATFYWTRSPNVTDNKLSTSAMEIISLVEKFSFNHHTLRCHWNCDLFITILQYAKGVPILSDSILKNISEIHSLEVCYIRDVYKEKIIEFTVDASEFFLRFVNLTLLLISNITISKISMKLLAQAFASNLQHLKQLILNNCGITSEIAIILVNKLRKTVDLEELQLCDNCIDDNASDVIVTTIFFWNSLKVLKLDNNRFTLKSITLFQFITKHFLGFSELSIDFNGDVDKVNLLITLLECANDTPLGSISKIECLHLDCFDKQKTDKQLELTVNASKYFQQFINLVKINISGIFVSEQASDMLAIALGNNLTSLESLIMNSCKVTSKVVVKLVKRLQNNKNIREIQFCNNLIRENAIETLAKAVINWDALEVLNLNKNQMVYEYEILSLFSMLIGQQSEFVTLMQKVPSTYWKDFFVVRTLIILLNYASNHTGKRVSHFTNVVSQITNLSLLGNFKDKPINADIELELTVGAATFFVNFSNVINLNLSGIMIGEEAADTLCHSFDFSKLCSLQMNDCKLTSRCVIKFLDALKCADIQVFEIQSNCIDDEASSPLIIAILHWNSLRTIALQGTSFSWKFHSLFQFLMNFLASSSQILTYSGNLQDISSFMILLEHMKEVSTKHSRLVKTISEIKDLYFHCSDKLYLGINHSNQQTKPIYYTDKLATDTKLEFSPDASHFFQRFVALTNLSINGIIMNENTAENLLVAFSNNIQTLQYVVLNYCEINSKVAIKLTNKLQKAKNIKEFQMCNNIIDDEATTALVVAILHWNLLTLLEVDDNKFSDKSMNLLTFVSRKYFMKYPLSSDCTSIECRYGGSTSMLTLLDILKNVSTEKSDVVKCITNANQLVLNCPSEQQITVYASLFFKRFTNLKELNLTSIIFDGISMNIITEALSSNLHGTLEFLTISKCHIDSPSAANILSSLNKNKIASLCLSDNGITNEAIEAILKFLYGNSTLQTINLASNYLKKEIIFRIKAIIYGCIKLQNIDISNNQITDDAAEAVIALSNHVRSLKVDGNELSDDKLKQLNSPFRYYTYS